MNSKSNTKQKKTSDNKALTTMIPKIKFIFDRHKRASNIKKGIIELRITAGSTQKFASTGISCFPDQWDNKHEQVINTLDAMQLNEILTKMRLKAIKSINDMMDKESFDMNEIIASVKTKKAVQTTFIGYIRKRIEEKPVSDYTKKAYHVFMSRFTEWGKMSFFSDINERNIRAWDEWLHNVKWTTTDKYNNEVEKKYSRATIGSMHKNLKAFINDAMVDGYVKENPYSTKRIKIDKGEARTDQYLTLEEVHRIETAEMPTRSLSEARDLFIFACNTALAYVDLIEFDKEKIVEIEGTKLYKSKRHKTLISFSSVITDKALEILEKYDYHLPKIPNAKYNVKLKLVADAAGIDKEISSHWARRSAAMIWLNNGVPIEVVSKILGHTNIAQTAEYAHVTDKTIISEIKKHIK